MANYYSAAARKKRREARADSMRFVSKREETITDFCITSAVAAYQHAIVEHFGAKQNGQAKALSFQPPDPVELAERFRALYLRESK